MNNLINKITHSSCLDRFSEIDDSSVDLCIIDPPYKLASGGCTTSAINGHFKKNGKATEGAKNGKVFKENDIKPSEYMGEIFRVLKDGSHFYVMCNDKHLKNMIQEGENAGFKLLNVLVWNKGMHTPLRYYLKNIEFVILFRKGKAKPINNMGSKALLDFQGIKGKEHPSEKPVELFEHFILNSSKENEIVLDCFIGSGTTAVASVKNNRKYIGFEIDEEYVKMGNNRLKEKN